MKKEREDFKIYEGVFDSSTLKTLYNLSENEHFDTFMGTIAEGKESSVYLAKNGKKHIAVKIFKTETADFRHISEYIISDPRFPKFSSKHREMVFLWCQKEYRNLMKCYEVGLSVPEPIVRSKNVLIMEFLGKGVNAYPTANLLPPTNPQEWYDKIIDMYRGFLKVDLVHADLSKFNVINKNDKPYVIDWAQAVLKDHSYAIKYLNRDVENVNNWFKSLGVKVNDKLFEELRGEFFVY